MEGGTISQQLSRDRSRSRPPPFLRTSSRSSNGTANARMTPHSNNSSTSNLVPPSPQQKKAHQSHRLHHSTSSRVSTSSAGDRPRSRQSKEPSTGDIRRANSQHGASTTSTFLQERLDRERKMETERSASRMSNAMSSSLELRAIQSSPIRPVVEARRPSSRGGADASKKGLGLKEMEEMMKRLQNHTFDLKLEIHHRRIRQAELEDKVENLEKMNDALLAEAERDKAAKEKAKNLEKMNDDLLAEVEKRDKAVEEAVAMILSLETRIGQLMQEREMVRRIDADAYSYAGSKPRLQTHNLSAAKLASLDQGRDDDTTLVRMPSFLSERSETTENLRSVYLGARASLVSLPRMSEDSNDADRLAKTMMASPSMSVLSESSFFSIYGQKNGPASTSSPPRDSEKSAPKNRSPSRSSSSRKPAQAPTRARRSGSLGRSNTSGTFSSITELMDMHSPLQRLEKMEQSLAAMNEASRPGSQEEEEVDQLSRQLKAQLQAKTKQEKRDALRKVRTDTPFTRDLLSQHNLPPTPDTISTSTLRRFKNSNDTLSREKDGNDRSCLATSEVTTSRSSSGEKTVASANGHHVSQPPSTSAFNSRRDHSVGSSYFDNRLPIPPRPRSADETTVSGHGRAAPMAWDSDSSEELNGNDSASLHDYWLRESLRPSGLNPADRKPKTSYGRTGRTSPDLFSFPTSTTGWATDSMFGTLGGAGYLGAGGAPLSQTLDALGESLPTPQAGLFGSGLASPGPNGDMIPPPPPNRRSSLHARTGTSSGSGTAPGTPAISQSARLRKSPTRRSRSNSIDARPASTGPQQPFAPSAPPVEQQQAVLPKSRHYPPASGATNAPKARMLSIFRRSGSHEPQPPAPSSAPPTETSFPKSVTAPLVGVPSWSRRQDLQDDDRDSATPPPILRNPRIGRRGSSGAEVTTGAGAGQQPGSPLKEGYVPISAEDAPAVDGANGGGGRRSKWLGFARVGSRGSRAG